jgi:hypothetical protein
MVGRSEAIRSGFVHGHSAVAALANEPEHQLGLMSFGSMTGSGGRPMEEVFETIISSPERMSIIITESDSVMVGK